MEVPSGEKRPALLGLPYRGSRAESTGAAVAMAGTMQGRARRGAACAALHGKVRGVGSMGQELGRSQRERRVVK